MIYKCGLEVVVVVVIAVLSELRGVHARGEGGGTCIPGVYRFLCLSLAILVARGREGDAVLGVGLLRRRGRHSDHHAGLGFTSIDVG